MGFSGATIEYTDTTVVKTSKDEASAERLNLSAQKQEWLRGLQHDRVGVPEIFDVTYDDNCRCVVSMERIHGVLLEDWIKTNGTQDTCHEVGVRLAQLVSQFRDTESFRPQLTSEWEFLHSKLVSAGDHVGMLLEYNHDSSDPYDYFELVRQATPPKIFPSGIAYTTACHGDLAFDNIIVDEDGKWWLIDPILHDFDGWMWDVAKVLQSTYIDWPAIRSGTIRPGYMLSWDEKLWRIMDAFLFVLEMKEEQDIDMYLAVTLARIIPYAKTVEQKEALLRLVNMQLRKVK